MAEKGIKVKLEIDSSNLKKQIQNAVDNATKGDGNKIVLSHFEIKSDGLRNKIQTAVNKATEKVPINLSQFHITNAGLDGMIKQVREALAQHPMTLEIASIDAKPAVERLRKQLTTMLSGLQIGGLKEFLGDTASSDALTQAAQAENKMAEALENVRNRAVNANVALKQLAAMSSILGAAKKSILNLQDGDKQAELNAIYDVLIHQVQRYRELIKQTGNAEDQEIQEAIAAREQEVIALRHAVIEQMNLESAARKTAKANLESLASAKSVSETQASIQSWVSTNSQGYERYKGSIDGFLSTLSQEGGITKATLAGIASEFNMIVAVENAALGSTKTLFDHMNGIFSTLAQFGLFINFGQQFMSTLRNMVTNVIELDSAMTELKKVTDLSTQSYVNFQNQAAAIAKNVGASVSDTISAAADFARLGFNINDAAQLAEAALVYKNVGDGINDISVATESLISTIKAFGIEATDSMYIVDMFNEVGNNFAISSVGIGDALQRSAAALSAAGNTIQESIGLVTAMNSVVQNPDAVGTAMKTLTMYLRAAKTAAADAGLETDGMADSVSKLRDELMSLTGVDIMIDENTFKSTYQIIQEISAKWMELSDVTKANVLNLLGGKRNANAISSLISNFATAEEAMADAMNALGSAAKENEAYLDSIEGRIARFHATFQELSSSIVNSSFVKAIIDIGTGILNIGLALEKVHAVLPAIVAGFIAFKGIQSASKATHLAVDLLSMVNSGKDAASIISSLSQAFLGLGGVGKSVFSTLISSFVGSNKAVGDVVSGFGQLTTATTAFSGASKTLSVAWAGIKTAFTSFGGPVMAVLGIIAAVTTAIDLYNKSQQAAIDKANDIKNAYTTAENTYKSNADALGKLKARFQELSNGVNSNGQNIRLTKSEYEEYKSIVQQIVDISPSVVTGYDNEGRAIIDYTNLVRDAEQANKDLLEAQRAAYLAGGDDLFKGKVKEYKNAVQQMLKAATGIDFLGTSNQFSDKYSTRYNALLEIAKKLNLELSRGMINFAWDNTDQNFTNIDNVISLYEKRADFMRELQATGSYTAGEIARIRSELSGLGAYYTEFNTIKRDITEYFMESFSEESWYSIIPIDAMDSMKSGMISLVDTTKSFKDNMNALASFGVLFSDAFSSSGFNELREASKELDGSGESTVAFMERVEAFASAYSGNAAVFQAIIDFFYNLVPATEGASSGVDDVTLSLNGLAASIKAAKSGLEILEKAKKDMADGGGLSSDTIMAIAGALEDGEQITDYLYTEMGVVKLNEQAWNARNKAMFMEDSKAISDEIGRVTAENKALKEQINLHEARAKEIRDEIEEYQDLIALGIEWTPQNAEELNMPWTSDEEVMECLAEYYDQVEALQTELEDLSSTLYDENQTYDASQAYLQKLWNTTVIYQTALDGLSDTVDELDFTSMFDGLNDVGNNAKSLIELYESITSDQLLTADQLADLYSKYPTLQSMSGFFDLSNAESQKSMIQSLINLLQIEWDTAINAKIAALEAQKATLDTSLDDELEQYAMLEATIGNLKSLVSSNGGFSLFSLFGNKDTDPGKTAEDYIKAAQAGINLYSSMQSGKDPFGNISSVLSMLDALDKSTIGDLILSASGDGITWDTAAIQTYTHKMIDAFVTTEQFGDKTEEVRQYLYNFADAEKEAADGAKTMSDALSDTDMAISFLEKLSKKDSSPIAMIESAIKMAERYGDGHTWTEFFSSVSTDGIEWNTQAIKDYGHAMVDSFITMSGMSEGAEDLRQQLYNLVDAEHEVTNATEKFASMSDAFSAINSVSSLLTDFKSGKADFLGIIKSLSGMADDWNKIKGENEQVHWWDFAEIKKDSHSIAWSTTKMHEYSDAMIDSAFAADAAGQAFAAANPEIIKLIKDQARAAIESTNALDKLKSAMSDTKSGASLIRDVLAEQSTTGVNSLDTISSLINLVGDGWASMVNWTADGPVIQIQNIITHLENEIDALTGVDDAQKNVMKNALKAAKTQESAAISIADAYKNAASAMKNTPGASENAELTYSAYQDLIAIDARYASAVEYQNGVLTLNRDKYEEVTTAVLRDTLAMAQAGVQAIVTSDEYQKLNSKIGELNEDEQKRLDSLNAEIMGYSVLASELINATSAYQRFLRASDAADADMYSGAEKALSVIRDTLFNKDSDLFGKIGREQFKAAMDFLIDPDIKVNTPEFDQAFKTIERYLEEGGVGVQNFIDDLFSSGLVDVTGNFSADMDTIAKKLGITTEFLRSMFDEYNLYADEDHQIKVDFDDGGTQEEAKSAEEQLAALTEQAETLNTTLDVNHDVTIETTTAETNLGNVSSALTDCINKLNSLNGKSVTSYVRTIYSQIGGTGGASGMSGFANANGTDGAPGGRTLVGEVGMETVVDPNTNRWYTVGAHGAEFVNLPKGAVVFDANQTRQLFSAGRTKSRGRAMLSGNANMESTAPDFGSAPKSSGGGLLSKLKNTVSGLFTKITTGIGSVVGGVVQKAKDIAQGTLQQEIQKPPSKPTGGGSGGGGSEPDKPSILDELQEEYEEAAELLDHLIEHQKILYDESERALNYEGMAASLSEQAKIYQQKMAKLQEGIDKMKAEGAEDTDEQLQKLEEAKWDAERSMFDVIDQLNSLYVDAINDKIDSIQDTFDKLKNAAEEFNKYGGITVDTFQSLLENGVQYLSLLDKVNGQYVINEEGINRMILAQKEQLAIEQALSYLNQVKEALMNGNANALANLADMTETISNNTWGAVDAMLEQLKTLGLSDEMYAKIAGNIEALHSLSDAVITDTTEAEEEQAGNIDYILKKTKEMIKYEKTQHIKAIQDEVKAYKDIVQAKKDSLQASKDEDNYQKSVNEKTKEIAELQARIDQLALDDSREARAERAALMKELAEKQGDLNDIQSDHAYDATMDALEAEADAYEQSRQAEIDQLEATLNSEEQLYQAAIQRISGGWDTLYQDLISWNTEAGNVLNSEITREWLTAADAAAEYGSYIGALEHFGIGDYAPLRPEKPTDEHPIVVANSHDIIAKGSPFVSSGAVAKGSFVASNAAEDAFISQLAEKVGAASLDLQKLQIHQNGVDQISMLKDAIANEEVAKNDSLVFNPVINISLEGYTNDEDARHAGRIAAESALDALYEAFERKGVTSTLGRQLKI